MKHYEVELPEEYESVKVIDAKDKKTVILMNVVVIIITFLLIYLGILIYKAINGPITFEIYNPNTLLAWLVMLILLIVVTIIHELVHGLFYKIFTKEKLTFGFTLSVAYCGVPHIYVYRKAMIVTAMAPCLILSTVLIVPLLLANSFIWFLVWLVLFSVHFAGCVGDIYSTFLLCFKYKSPTTLINDTGPKQTIYQKRRI